MIDWKPFNPKTAGDEIEENTFLILLKNGRIEQATHDAMYQWFNKPYEDYDVTYSYSNITHYAEYNLPNETE